MAIPDTKTNEGLNKLLARQEGYKAGVAAAKAAFDPSPYASLDMKDRARLETFVPPMVFGEAPKGMSAEELEALAKIDVLLGRATPEERKVILKRLHKEYAREKRRHDEDKENTQRKIDKSQRIIAALQEADSKVGTTAKLEKPPAPSFNDLRRAVSRNDVMYGEKDADGNEERLNLGLEKDLFRHANHFVVEHDWAAAFAKTDLGEFKLPYSVCIFDFQVNGTATTAIAIQDDNSADMAIALAVKTSLGWLIPWTRPTKISADLLEAKEKGYLSLLPLLARQVRAISIALDAEVAVTEVMRAPHSGKSTGGKHTLPPISYHVVSLAKRQRAAPRLGSHPTGRHVRLHFRRGHWRHYEDSKTWIKWTLVGDPDLGFVDKHYKL